MAFSFGAPAQPAASSGFGAAAPKPTFGGFGATTSQPSTGFGGFGTTAAPAPAAAFGAPSTGFGAPASTATGFGGFGAPTAQPSTGFGGFGAPASTAAPTGFGVAAQPSTGFGGFGATAAPATGFGAPNTGFGAPASTATGFGGFGAPAAQTSTGFGGFGAAAGTKPTGFGTTFGAGSTLGGGFGATTGFGAPSTGFGAPGGATAFAQPQTQQQQPSNPVDNLFTAVLHCNLYNDERDGIIARWNMLQASWGQGKAYFSNQAQPVPITPENPFCRFKAIGYSAMPKHDNKDGLVSIMFKKKLAEVESGKAQLTSGLTQLLGNKPGLKVNIETVKSVSGDNTEVVITVQETQQNGASRKVPASDLHSFLNSQANNLKTMGVEMVIPKLSFSQADITQYLADPPSGVDARLWKQAQADNPDPKKLLPVPMIGFRALQARTVAQEQQAKAQAGRLDTIAGNISELQKKATDTQAALTEAKRRQLELSHRVLRVLVRQESTRKVGFTITQQEEVIRGQLEALQAELATPTQFKGRLNELLSQVRLQSQTAVLSGGEKYTLDQFAVNDIKSVLKDQQEGIQALVSCVKEDLKDLAVMTSGLEGAKAQS